MNTLAINDLVISADLDRKAMTSVRGGSRGYPGHTPSMGPSFSATSSTFNFGAMQGLGQSQNTAVNNGNNAAFVCGITSDVHPTQDGSNNISIGAY
ncbi:hypothetical protein [Noviherbaspirillum galbum]|uniref:Uncharacterized protein n=1 Tax=Noviherbaspirillum galbum TaxID=2709383 RepID=A0A6B3SQJ1_9BURK|nr:hypothetical protein [Noviherbaspirillum galbum]NEX62788.1 hypothetical protein [Noviherbaspirillum galbum]